MHDPAQFGTNPVPGEFRAGIASPYLYLHAVHKQLVYIQSFWIGVFLPICYVMKFHVGIPLLWSRNWRNWSKDGRDLSQMPIPALISTLLIFGLICLSAPSLNKNKHTKSKRKLSRELKGWVFFIFCLLLPHRTRRTCHLIDSWRKLLTTDDEANMGGKMRSFDETERFQINNMSQPSPYNASLFPDRLGSVWPRAENTSPSYSDSLRGLLCLQIQEDIVYDSGWARSDTTGSTPIF